MEEVKYSKDSKTLLKFNGKGKTFTIPQGVTKIGDEAFKDCPRLTTIKIPDSVTKIGKDAFSFSRLKSIKIPDSVTTIGAGAFSYCSDLESITLPASLKQIEEGLFCFCHSLQSLRIPDSVKVIGRDAFCGCYGLISVQLPNKLTGIGNRAFEGCCSLSSLEIPKNVTSIGHEAFRDCEKLSSIVIPNKVKVIESNAFLHCTSLTSISIPKSVTTIEKDAFEECSGLSSIVVAASNPVYDSRDNCNAIIETATNTLLKGCMKTSIPKGITRIEEGAFNACYGLTSITIPSSVTTIGNDAFCECINLTTITIPEGVTKIGNNAFSGCTGLTSIKVPNSVTEICNGAFSDCTSLRSIRFPKTRIMIASGAFDGCKDSILNKVRHVDKSGVVYNNKSRTELVSVPEDLKEYVLPHTVEKIHDDALKSCHLERLLFEEGQERINCFDFSGIDTLKEIYIPESAQRFFDTHYWCADPMMGCTDVVFSGKKFVRDGQCVYSEDRKKLYFVGNLEDGILVVPPTVEECFYAFRRSDVREVHFSPGCKRVSGFGLHPYSIIDWDDTCLNTVIFPDSIEYVGLDEFSEYLGLEHVYVPDDKVDYFRELLPEHLAKHVEPISEQKKKTKKKKAAKEPKIE